MKYIIGLIILIILVVVIVATASKIPTWLGFEKAKEPTKVEAPAKKATQPTTPTPATKPVTIGYLPNVSDSEIPAGFKREQLSPYFKKIRISSLSYSTWGSYPAYITLSASLTKDEAMNITGWRIKGNLENILIPQAIEVYDPSGFGGLADIVLKNYQTVNFYSSFSPISRNFRLNKCAGYLEEIYDFNPPLPRNCPYVNRTEISNLSGVCQSYILSLSSCKMPETNLTVTLYDENCRVYLNNLNYRGCFNRYRLDPDFLSSEWRVWVGRNILDPNHDQVLLLDKNNLLVDIYTY